MSQFEDLECPRSNKRTVHLVQDKSKRVIALSSRVGARNMRKEGNYTKLGAVEVEDGEAHIGDKIWFVLSNNTPIAAYHNENKARAQDEGDNNVVGVPIQYWNITNGNLYTKKKLEKHREKGLI